MNRNGQNNRGRARGRQAQMTASVRRLKHDITGHVIKPSQDPTSFVELPWNSWTFERTDTTAQADSGDNVSVQNVIDQLRARVGLSTTAVIRIKVQSARIWCTAVGPTFAHPDMRGIFYEINGQGTSATARSTQRDIGTLNAPARVGYQYPIDDRKEVLTKTDNATQIAGYVVVGSGSEVSVRIQILWQATGP